MEKQQFFDNPTLEKIANSRKASDVFQRRIYNFSNREFILTPLDEMNVPEQYSDERSELSKVILEIMNDEKLLSSVYTCEKEIEFAHFLMDKKLLAFSGDKDERYLNRIIYPRTFEDKDAKFPDMVLYEGYSHLVIDRDGLKVATQEVDYFDDFSRSPTKLVQGFKKIIHPVCLLHTLNGKYTPVFFYQNCFGRKVMTPVSTSMKNGSHMEHMIVAYYGNGRTEFDYSYPDVLGIGVMESNITSSYIMGSLQDSVKKLLGKKKK